jgi:hypothetical protein
METGINAITAALVAGPFAIVIAAAPIASAASSEQQCLEQHCLQVDAPTISQRPDNVQIFTSPKDMPAVYPHSNKPKWRGLDYDARWPTLGHNPKWQDFGYSPKWDGFQTALLPDPGMSLPEPVKRLRASLLADFSPQLDDLVRHRADVAVLGRGLSTRCAPSGCGGRARAG